MPIPSLPAPWILTGLLLLGLHGAEAAPGIQIGSKKFTESVILGEMVRLLLREHGIPAAHRRELGGTRILWGALLGGDVDVYPEYTGTLRQEILGPEVQPKAGHEGLREALARQGVGMTASLGFENTYAIGMQAAEAARLGIETLSDLARFPALTLGLSNEFMNRSDGWPGLRRRYGLRQSPRGMDHDLAYRALAAGEVDAVDLYTTDAEIPYYGLRVLVDDLAFFPAYQAVLLYRRDGSPGMIAVLQRLAGTIDAAAMATMNARVKLDGETETAVAASFLATRLSLEPVTAAETLGTRLWQRTREHLFLVAVSLGAAIITAIPLGILAARRRRLGQALLAGAGILQTIPALALLVVMIPPFGIGAGPAIVALFLYSLLPVLRNTHAGLGAIDPALIEAADALGLPRGHRLWRIELPLAAGAILAGIKTSAVINVGTATLGALIGAGGYGQPILTGIRLDDTGLILEGAIPAAVLALSVQGLLDLAERRIVPPGLRA
jgi:osmoprotectant transport system permease protein